MYCQNVVYLLGYQVNVIQIINIILCITFVVYKAKCQTGKW